MLGEEKGEGQIWACYFRFLISVELIILVHMEMYHHNRHGIDITIDIEERLVVLTAWLILLSPFIFYKLRSNPLC